MRFLNILLNGLMAIGRAGIWLVRKIMSFLPAVGGFFVGLFKSRGGETAQTDLERVGTAKIRNRLILSLLTIALIPLIILGVFGYNTAKQALENAAQDQLRGSGRLRVLQMRNWITDRKGDAYFARNLAVVRGSPGSGINEGLAVLTQYKNNRSHPSYQEAAFRAERVLGSFSEALGGGVYLDMQMVDRSGQVVWALNTDEVGKNVAATIEFREGLKRLFVGDINNQLIMTVSVPVLGAAGIAGVLELKVDANVLNDLMTDRTGLGETGESYLVGQDFLMRSDSPFVKEMGVTTTILLTAVNTLPAESAQAGESGYQRTENYRGQKVLSYWDSVDVQEASTEFPEGLRWAVITEIHAEEVDRPVVQFRNATVIVVVAAAFIVLIVAFFIARGMTRQVDAITRVFNAIGIGNFDARASIVSNDELGLMALSLNAMLDNTLSLIQSRDERDRVQGSISKLLEEVSGVAEGDLTREAEVTADVTGAIADSFNFMIHSLRRVIGQVQDVTLQVSSSATQIQATAEQLSQGSDAQAMQIADTSGAIEEMAVSTNQVAENAQLTATVSEQARDNAKKGAEAVKNTIAGMSRIRDQVQETAKRIKRLGESSQEIGEIVEVISDIADRTSILALNASIQAAMAGEAGRGFAVVAEEVERLADRSTQATKQISTLVKTIQTETNDAVAAMEASTNEVVAGSRLAEEAGAALTEIQGVSTRAAELVQSISLAARQQARGAETLAKSMAEISQVTQQTAAGTRQAAKSVGQLTDLANSLRATVSAFKLPQATNGSAAIPATPPPLRPGMETTAVSRRPMV